MSFQKISTQRVLSFKYAFTGIISALKEIPVKQDIAMTGSLSVRGDVLPVGGVSSKVEAAIEAGIKNIIVPKSNLQDIIIDKAILSKVRIIPVAKEGLMIRPSQKSLF